MELYPFSFHEFLKLEQVAIKQDTFYAAEGRYVTMELYPFSFHEFLKLEQVAIKQDTFYAAEGKVLLLSEIQKARCYSLVKYKNT